MKNVTIDWDAEANTIRAGLKAVSEVEKMANKFSSKALKKLHGFNKEEINTVMPGVIVDILSSIYREDISERVNALLEAIIVFSDEFVKKDKLEYFAEKISKDLFERIIKQKRNN